jgi:hypothetical protein
MRIHKIAVVCMLVLLVVPTFGLSTGASKTYQTYGRFASNLVDGYMEAAEWDSSDVTDVQWDDDGNMIPWWVDMVDASEVSNDGEGVYVAVLDTGLLSDWEYIFGEANIADEYGKGFSHTLTWDDGLDDFVWSDVEDDRGFITKAIGNGHGSHVTSTIVGYDFGVWVRGVAPKANIIPVLVLDTWLEECPDPDYVNEEWGASCEGGYVLFDGGTNEMVAAGIMYAADLKEDLDAPLIISMSLGGPEPNDMIEDAIDYAIEKGCIVVVSAGGLSPGHLMRGGRVVGPVPYQRRLVLPRCPGEPEDQGLLWQHLAGLPGGLQQQAEQGPGAEILLPGRVRPRCRHCGALPDRGRVRR